MPPHGSVTCWIRQLKDGDPAAAQKLWELYFERLVGLAHQKLQGVRRGAGDEEDVALSALDSFCRGAGRGRFPQLADRHNLWRVLVVITARKALDLRAREGRQKRGGGRVFNEAALRGGHRGPAPGLELEEVVGREPTPAFAAQVAEECRRLLAELGNDELRAIAVWKMEGYTNAEIAARLGCVEVTVERRLRLIRGIWEKEPVP